MAHEYVVRCARAAFEQFCKEPPIDHDLKWESLAERDREMWVRIAKATLDAVDTRGIAEELAVKALYDDSDDEPFPGRRDM